MKSRLLFLSAILLYLAAPPVSAQEFMSDERIKVSNDSPSEPVPTAVFNGTEHGVFFFWAGSQDKDAGLHFRRLDRDGNPLGGQKLVAKLGFGPTYSSPICAVWDGEAYIVAIAGYRENLFILNAEPATLRENGYLFRVSPRGELLAQKTFPKEKNRFSGQPLIFVIGERVFLFFDQRKAFSFSGGTSYLVVADRLLQEEPKVKKLPKGDLRFTRFIGASHDADKFVVLLAEFAFGPSFEFEVRGTQLLHINFKGNVIDAPLSSSGRGATISSKSFLADAYEVAGPLFDGKDFFLIVVKTPFRRFILGPAGHPYTNQSYKINDRGEVTAGPFDLGSSHTPYVMLAMPVLAGNHFSTLAFDLVVIGNEAILAGRNGKHMTNLFYEEARFVFVGGYEAKQAYTGTANTIVFLGSNNRYQYSWGMNVYARQYSMPEYSKPGFFYFIAGESEPEPNKHLVMWSTVLTTNVKLSGPDFEMDNLPPVWSYLVDTKGKTTKVMLTITFEDGSTKTRKLTIEP